MWNDLKRSVASKKGPEMTYSKQETTRNDPQRVRYNLKWRKLIYNKQKNRSETTNNNQILRLFYYMGQLVLFSNTYVFHSTFD